MTKNRRILVVEDSLFMQEFIKKTLSTLGHEAEMVASGAKAIDVITENSFDIIFLDCQIPILDGYEVAQEIRDREAKGFIKNRNTIIACTANNMEGDAQRCIDSGMDDHMAKPVSLERVEAMLSKWLKN